MNPASKTWAYILLHVATILYGLTAILGDLISISALNLVWWRVFITSLSLLVFVRFGKGLLSLGMKTIWSFIGIGALVAFHWLTFYGAIKVAENASIVLAAFATTSLFTSILEPLFTDKKFDWVELLLGLLIIPAIFLILNDLDFNMLKGFYIAIISAFTAAIFATLNKKMVDKGDSFQITFIEMMSATVLLGIFLPFVNEEWSQMLPSAQDWIYLIILALACTTFAFIITLKALKVVSAFEANLVINLEPVYGIILAIVILNEHKELSPRFYWGALIILVIVFSHPLISHFRKKLNHEK